MTSLEASISTVGNSPQFSATHCLTLKPLKVDIKLNIDYIAATLFTRRKMHLEEEIGHLIDLNKEGLDKLDDKGLEDHTDSNDYAFEGINLNETSLDKEGYGSEVDDDGLSNDDRN